MELRKRIDDKNKHERAKPTDNSNPPVKRRVNFIKYNFAYISLCVMNRKLTSFIVASFLLCLYFVSNLTLSNDTLSISTINSLIENDYSSIRSKYDLNIGSIDHWCLQGGDQNCSCEDPLIPASKSSYPKWIEAHTMNKELVEKSIEKWGEDGIDVVFVGANMVELWAGRSVSNVKKISKEVGEKFVKNFNREKRGKYNGIPLGIAGDTTPNVLWRIQNGEIPDNLNPKIFWLVLGTNDLALRQCSEEVVLLGILRVIEEIQEMRPDAKIVVNSILPMSTDKQGRVPNISFSKAKKKFPGFMPRRLKFETLLPGVVVGKRGDVVPVKGRIRKRDELPVIRIVNSSRFSFTSVSIAMWPSVAAINLALKKFCSRHTRMLFFDSFDVFVDDPEGKIPKISSNLMMSSGFGQPSISGHEKFLKEISSEIDYIWKKFENNKMKKGNEKNDENKLTDLKESSTKLEINKMKKGNFKKDAIGDSEKGGERKDLEPIPSGTVVKLKLSINSGNYNDPSRGWIDNYATKGNTGSVFLKAVSTVLEGKYKGRKIKHTIGLHSPTGSMYGDMGQKFIRTLLESARNIGPNDQSPGADLKRSINSIGDLDGLIYLADVEMKINTKGNYKNEISEIITPSDTRYHELMSIENMEDYNKNEEKANDGRGKMDEKFIEPKGNAKDNYTNKEKEKVKSTIKKDATADSKMTKDSKEYVNIKKEAIGDSEKVDKMKYLVPIPLGTVVKLKLNIESGNYNDPSRGWIDNYATKGQTGSVFLKTISTVLEGKYEGRKIKHTIGLHSPTGRMYFEENGRNFIKALLESARNIDPNDQSSEAISKRSINSYRDLDGVVYLADVKPETDQKSMFKNVIHTIITPSDTRYHELMGTST